MKKTKKGFTLVELLVVIAILATLSTVAIVSYVSFVNKADESAAKAEAEQIDLLIETALVSNDAIKIKDELWIIKTQSGYEATTTPQNDATDMLSDFADFTGQFSNSDGKLMYTSRGYIVDVDTRTTTKQ